MLISATIRLMRESPRARTGRDRHHVTVDGWRADCPPELGGEFVCSIVCWFFFDVVDDENRIRTLLCFELQSKLFLDGVK
jgi:hypothetical protein